MATATMTTATMAAAPAAETYKLELMSAYGPVFRDVLNTAPRDCDSSEVPTIDLSNVRGSDQERKALAKTIQEAAENTGFFYIKNHGIPKAHIDAAFKQAQAFFSQPTEKKAEVSHKQSKYFNGWSERRETGISPTESRDHREGFSFRYDPKFDPEPKDLDAIPEDVKNCLRCEDFVWDRTAHLPEFKEDMVAYWRDSVVNYYPKNTEAKDTVIDVGLGAHTDLQCFTFLWQDYVGGLQVLNKEGQWIKVPPVPDTFVVNIGDFLMRLSNDRFQSTVHRVFNYAPEDRYSMPFFFGFNFNEKCTVLPSCTSEENPPKYEPISCGEMNRENAGDEPDPSDQERPMQPKQHAAEETVEDNPSHKRRRRVFSCESCQRLKCKCDYDFNLQSCRRCQILRITCSRRETVEMGDLMTSDINNNSIQDRLSKTENALREITTQLEALTKQIEQSSCKRAHIQSSSTDSLYPHDAETFGDGLEQVLDPADHAVRSAPVVVLRDLDRRYTGGHRRPRTLADVDLVESQLIHENMARELIQLFFHHRSDRLIVSEPNNLTSSDILRDASPFLHSVCCLHAIIYREDLFGTATHRKIYEHNRISLGKVLLSVPLTLEDIQGVFLMSENVMAGHGDNGKEYIDSWMLTGYCITQAMLSISFSEIVKNIRQDITTPEDQRAIRLWSTICLDHLYFYGASMQDGMLLAEILLCTTLLQKLGTQAPLDPEGHCIEFAAWKDKWNHLLSMPTASMLRIGYFSACLILLIRSLEDLGENLQSTTLLSNSSPTVSNEFSTSTEQGATQDSIRVKLRSKASKYAQSIIETFLNMPSSLRDSIASNRCLCLGYSALILTHYDETQSSISDEHKLNLITRFEEWLNNAPGTTWAIMFGRLAKQKLMSRVHSNSFNQRGGQSVFSRTDARKAFPNRDQMGFSSQRIALKTTERVRNGRQIPIAAAIGEPILTPTDAASVWSTPAPLSYEFQPDFVFPNMEDFFSGGFLDFGGLE
ncbi:hypothetical protein G7Z17_g2589 [Cylindrodendrum hubeiense]|uniref:Fe2OG dioxygenase domain-containing protein n=1 Tax=Cylindrodendrum hubeiense TaxID=595255 RepID=A0A9P5HDX9_9HYPO|nr:hypothetical protein G7Z17_g2589 [Cylindrodendrum hubeiense]